MKRLHVHVSVKHLPASIRFYRTLYGADPVVTRSDFAKWMLDDPRVNFDSDEELRGMRAQLETADALMVEENENSVATPSQTRIGLPIPPGSHGKHFILWAISRFTAKIPVFNHGEATMPTEAPASGFDPAQRAQPASCCAK